jgi:diadenylate cyclase
VEIEQLVQVMQILDLSATSRGDAIRELVRVGNWEDEGISSEEVVQAIEAREATAQTIVATGLALPHAAVEWDGDYRLILGRSRCGVPFGAAGDLVHLIVLMVVGRRRERTHLEALAQVAELLKPEEFRQALVEAPHAEEISRLLAQRASREPAGLPEAPPEMPRLSAVLVRQAVELARSRGAQALLLAVDRCESVPWGSLASWTGRLLVVTTETADELKTERPDTHLFDIPHASLSRMDRANLGLLLAAARGLINDQADVVCVTGPAGQQLDSITVTKPGGHFRDMFSQKREERGAKIRPAVILRVLSLAVELASEGREARPIGAMFVIGDTRQVMRRAQQLVLNPFHGFARRLRNLLDPSLAETIKEFALLDGAFIIQADGTALSAGTYLVPESRVTDLPGGLGTRHQAAAAITTDTRALAVTVSQSTGTVTVFQNGGIVLTLERATMTRW